jgi:hypothetical protein
MDAATPGKHVTMIAPEHSPAGAGSGATPSHSVEPDDQPVTTLRGAQVNVDMRRAGRVVLGGCLVALVAAGAILLVAGIHSNGQITELRQHGVPVTATVTGCAGLMGGTGAQSAGYSCTATYTLDGAKYHQAIPGLAFHATGTKLAGVAVPGDPKLFSTPGQAAARRASWRVLIIPGLLLVVAVVVGVLWFRGRSSTRRGDGSAAVGAR